MAVARGGHPTVGDGTYDAVVERPEERREVKVGEEPGLDVRLLGKCCRVTVENVTKGRGRYSNVVDELPSRA